MRRLHCILYAALLSGCTSNFHKDIRMDVDDWDNMKPGTIVDQTVNKLDNGFYELDRSIINSADHWEGVGHFSFIFYQDVEICRCSTLDTVISPGGKYIIYYSHARSRLELYGVDFNKVIGLSEDYIGYPSKADWDLANNQALIYLSNPNGKDKRELKISLIE